MVGGRVSCRWCSDSKRVAGEICVACIDKNGERNARGIYANQAERRKYRLRKRARVPRSRPCER